MCTHTEVGGQLAIGSLNHEDPGDPAQVIAFDNKLLPAEVSLLPMGCRFDERLRTLHPELHLPGQLVALPPENSGKGKLRVYSPRMVVVCVHVSVCERQTDRQRQTERILTIT